MLARLEMPCPCGDAFPITEGGSGPCPRCGAQPSEATLRAIPPMSVFRVWHVALISVATCLAAIASTLTYSMQSQNYLRVFQDLGRTLPALTNAVMHREVVLALYGSVAATCVYVFLLARQRIRRGGAVGIWPGRVLFWLLFLTLVLDAVIAEAFSRPFIELIESLR